MKKIYLIVLLGTFVFAGCKKQDTSGPLSCGATNSKVSQEEDGSEPAQMMNTDADFNRKYSRLNFKTLFELAIARAASAKYQDFEKAKRDKYADINVVMPNMGYHFMKSEIVDSVFDIAHPEILVYNKNKFGKFELVAVEYAVPLDKSVNAPKGFTGSADIWDHNDAFGLWLLHAWVWQFNPAGVFNPTNPTVHVRQ